MKYGTLLILLLLIPGCKMTSLGPEQEMCKSPALMYYFVTRKSLLDENSMAHRKAAIFKYHAIFHFALPTLLLTLFVRTG